MNGKGITVFGYKSPCGVMLIGDYDGRLCMCDWDLPQRDKITASRIARTLDTRCVEGKTMLIERAVYQLDEYLNASEERLICL